MADIIQEVSSANNYAGNAGLGGAVLGGVTLDTKPIENLAHYAYYYNKSEHEQRQADADAKIKELADITAYDPNTAIEKDKPAAIEAYKNLIDYTSNYARQQPKTAQDKLEQEWEYKKQIAQAQKTIRSATERAIAYNKRKSEINDNTSITQAQKDVLMKDLNDDVAKTDINTALPSENKFDQTIPKIKQATLQTFEVSTMYPDNNIQTKVDIANPTQMLREAQAEQTGLDSLFSGEHKEFFKASGNQYQVFNDAAAFLASAVANPKYKKPDGSIDFNAIQQANPLVHDVLSLATDFNKWSAGINAQAKAGVFTDRLGKNYKSITPVNPDDWFQIDLTKPITADQLIMLHKFQEAPKLLTTDETLQHTGEGSQNARAAAAQSGENYRARLANERALKVAKLEHPQPVVAGANDNPDDRNMLYAVKSDPNRNELVMVPKTDKDGKSVAPTRPVISDGKPISIYNGVAVGNDGKQVDLHGTFLIPASAIGDQIITEYNKNAAPKWNASTNSFDNAGGSSIKVDANGFVPAKFDHGEIVGIETSTGSIAGKEVFKTIGDKIDYKGVKKGVPRTEIGVEKGTPQSSDQQSLIEQQNAFRKKYGLQ